MAVEVNPNNSVKHEGVIYKAGQIIQDLEEAAKAELVKLGVVKDLDADVSQVENQAKADLGTAEKQASQDEELARGQVDDQVAANAKKDLEDAERLAATPGETIVNNKPSGIIAKAKAAISGNQPAAAPPAPTAEQIAADPQLQQ
jgi:hypothetical protein